MQPTPEYCGCLTPAEKLKQKTKVNSLTKGNQRLVVFALGIQDSLPTDQQFH